MVPLNAPTSLSPIRQNKLHCLIVAVLALLTAAPPVAAAGPEKLSFRTSSSAPSSGAGSPSLLRSGPLGKASLQMRMETAPLVMNREGRPELEKLPAFTSSLAGRYTGRSVDGKIVFYTLRPELQELAEQLVRNARSPHVAIALMEPRTGKLLALAEKSKTISDALLHDGVPAASLFKVVTSAAALERSKLGPFSKVYFRGGPYTLERWNYLPDPRRDRISMTLAEALGKSCNPVFGRVATSHLSAHLLSEYARAFGFNRALDADINLPVSDAYIPSATYELSRSAAGFGKVFISPIHAVTLMATVANGGVIPRPQLISEMFDGEGRQVFRGSDGVLGRAIQAKTASTLMEMMRYTTTVGTSRSEFVKSKYSSGFPVPVAAKTGTLRGTNPKGLNQWFIAAAPLVNPKVAVAVLVVDPGNSSSKASRMGRQVLERALKSL